MLALVGRGSVAQAVVHVAHVDGGDDALRCHELIAALGANALDFAVFHNQLVDPLIGEQVDTMVAGASGERVHEVDAAANGERGARIARRVQGRAEGQQRSGADLARIDHHLGAPARKRDAHFLALEPLFHDLLRRGVHDTNELAPFGRHGEHVHHGTIRRNGSGSARGRRTGELQEVIDELTIRFGIALGELRNLLASLIEVGIQNQMLFVGKDRAAQRIDELVLQAVLREQLQLILAHNGRTRNEVVHHAPLIGNVTGRNLP